MYKRCDNCKYIDKGLREEPCSRCKNNKMTNTREYESSPLLWEPYEKNNENTPANDIVNRPTIKKIRELSRSEVIPAIVNNETVLRINLDKMIVCNLENKSISTIRNDFKKDCYLYLIVEDWREAI